MALGVTVFAMMNTALLVVEDGKNQYYQETRLGDVFAQVAQIPGSALVKLDEIDGIGQVDGRLIKNIRVMMPDNKEDVITLKMISVKPAAGAERLNNYVVSAGEDLKQREDVLVGYDFYMAYGYKPNDPIAFVLDGNIYNLKVKGGVYAPEYVYIVQNETELFSDTTKYNIAFIDEKMLMDITGLDGLYNDLSFALEDGYGYEDVKDELEYELEKYGLISLYDRKDLLSYSMLEEEIRGGRSMSTSMPMTFVAMAGIVLYLMLKRLIEQERSQIGTLKAFGYSDGKILFHYIYYGLITGVVGAVMGILIGNNVTGSYIDFYLEYYKMPISNRITDYTYFYWGCFMAVAGGVGGAYFGARHVIKLSPAEAMRPKSPRPIRKDITKLFPILKVIFTARGFMAARNIIRNKVRSSFVVIGIVFTFGMMAMIGMMNGVMDAMLFNQFNHVLKYDAEIALAQDVPYQQGVESVLSLDGVTYAEGIMKTPVRVYNGFLMTGTTLVGIRQGSQIYKLYDDELKYNKKTDDSGIILSSMVADALQVEKGDSIYLAGPYFDSDRKIYVHDILTQSVGGSAYIDLGLLSGMMDRDVMVNALIIKYSDIGQIRETLINSEQVRKIEDKTETLAMYEQMLDSYAYLITVMQIVAVLIGFTIIYNTAVITMSERSREYATLRVIGLTIHEVREIMSFEYWLLCFAGIILGIPFAYMLNAGLQQAIDIDVFSWPSTIPLSAYVTAAVGCIGAVFFSNMTSVKTIRKLDLVEVLKERE